MASLAAMLLIVAWNMSEARRVVHLLRVGPRQDVMVLLICLILTVLFDMVLAVGVGLLLAAALFIKRMADLSHGAKASFNSALRAELPDNVALYRIQGPLFFAAADKALGTLGQFESQVEHLIIDMQSVPSIDMSALVLFEQALQDMQRRGIHVYLTGVKAPIRLKLRRVGLDARRGVRSFAATPERAAQLVREQLAQAAVQPEE
jgi:SulP family sulfate permease